MSIVSVLRSGSYDRVVSDIESEGLYDEYPIYRSEYNGKRLLKVWRTEFLLGNDEAETWRVNDGDTEWEYILNPSPACVVSVLRDLDLSFSAYGDGLIASQVDGSENNGDTYSEDGVEFEPRSEVFAELIGFTPAQCDAIAEWTDEWNKPSKCL